MMAWFHSGSEYLAGFWWMLMKQSLFASLVFLGVWLLTRSSRLRSPRLLYGLWSLVFIRLVLPPGFSLPWSLSSLFADVQPAFLPAQTLTVALPHFGPDISHALTPTSASSGTLWFWWVPTCLWLIGVVYLLTRFYTSRRVFRKLVLAAQPVEDPRVRQATARWRQHLGIRRQVRVVHADRSISPFTIGLTKPLVFLPSSLLKEKQAPWEPALAHELAHVKRCDDLWIQCLAWLKAIYFFHPLVWVCFRKCQHERERLCDRAVIQSGEMSPATYGQALLDIFARQFHSARGLPALSPAAKLVANRLTSLNQYKGRGNSPLLGTVFILVLALLMLPMATTGATQRSAPGKALTWRHPLPQARTTSKFGFRTHPFSKEKAFHKGIDWVAPKGAWILAPADGVVLQASANYERGDSYGTVIVLQHNDTYTSFFSHLDAVAVRPGQKVTKGTRLGTVGGTGQVTAPHLHFEIWEHGKPVNPFDFVQGHE